MALKCKKALDKVKAGEAEYHFIEIMACPAVVLRRRTTHPACKC